MCSRSGTAQDCRTPYSALTLIRQGRDFQKGMCVEVRVMRLETKHFNTVDCLSGGLEVRVTGGQTEVWMLMIVSGRN